LIQLVGTINAELEELPEDGHQRTKVHQEQQMIVVGLRKAKRRDENE